MGRRVSIEGDSDVVQGSLGWFGTGPLMLELLARPDRLDREAAVTVQILDERTGQMFVSRDVRRRDLTLRPVLTVPFRIKTRGSNLLYRVFYGSGSRDQLDELILMPVDERRFPVSTPLKS